MLTYLGSGARDYGNQPLLPMRRDAWEFQAVTAGRCAPVSDVNEKPSLQALTLWVFPPNHLHGWTSRKGRPCKVFVAHFDTVPDILDTGGVTERPLTRADARRLDALADMLEPHHRAPDSHSFLHVEHARTELVLMALKNVPAKPIHYDQQRVNAAIAWYHQHMSQRAGVHDMAEAAHVSVAHLRRLFIRHRRMPPQAVMRRMQIQRAQELMMSTQLPLSHIAEACGFSCLSSFSRSHQDLTGQPPSAWREKAARIVKHPRPDLKPAQP
ncbi:MAG: helix-turn-helix transcriptional regulator [Phycisphaerales bacterium]